MIHPVRLLFLLPVLFGILQCSRKGETLELHIVAGQSNAQGYQGDAAFYPADPLKLDAQIPFYYKVPSTGDSGGTWVTLGPQKGRFLAGHFGPEVTFARALRQAGGHPAIFKYTKPATSLAKYWLGPGEDGAWEGMCRELTHAIKLLKEQHRQVKIRSFTWIQGESDAETDEMAALYEKRLAVLVRHIRALLHEPDLPVIVGLDEQHPWVQKHPVVIEAQKHLAAQDSHMAFLSMQGLEKFDTSHLTPKGLVQHGQRLFEVYQQVTARP